MPAKGKSHSAESREKKSVAAKGRKFTDEHRENLSKAKMGKKLTDEHRENISKGQMGRNCSTETRAKLRDSKCGHPVFCTTNGVTYPSISEAARTLGLNPSGVSNVCHGKQNHTGGYQFKFIVDIPPLPCHS